MSKCFKRCHRSFIEQVFVSARAVGSAEDAAVWAQVKWVECFPGPRLGALLMFAGQEWFLSLWFFPLEAAPALPTQGDGLTLSPPTSPPPAPHPAPLTPAPPVLGEHSVEARCHPTHQAFRDLPDTASLSFLPFSGMDCRLKVQYILEICLIILSPGSWCHTEGGARDWHCQQLGACRDQEFSPSLHLACQLHVNEMSS